MNFSSDLYIMEILIFEDKTALARSFGELLSGIAIDRDSVYIALSGGSTPKVIFDLLAAEFRRKIDWGKLKFFWGDDRCVPPDHPDSNYGMTRQHLFDKLPIPESNIYRVKGELPVAEAVADYIEVVDKVVPKKNGLPRFDIMMLGMGDDGHTASIFPYAIDLWESPNLCEEATHPQSGQKRVTMTGNVINNSELTVFLVTGSNKAEKVDEIINGKVGFSQYPAALADGDKLLWMLDKEAAANLM